MSKAASSRCIPTDFEDLFALPEDLASHLLPYIPRFHYALLDLSRFDPDTQEHDTRLRVVLQLMKLARQKELLRFFHWLAGCDADDLPDDILGVMLLYALHADSDLDVRKIYHTLSSNPELERNAMSVAEKLRAEGRVEGRVEGLEKGLEKGRVEGRAEGQEKGLWIGKIQSLQEFLDLPVNPSASLEEQDLDELKAIQQRLHQEYGLRFKRR